MASKEEAFLRLAGVVRRLFHQLRSIAEAASPREEGFTVSHRAVLESLSAGGPETVPALARARPVARQHIQVLVNDLLRMGYVEALPNPAHKRSPMIALTDSGRRRFTEIRRAEREVLRTAKLPLTQQEMTDLASRLESLSAALRELASPPE